MGIFDNLKNELLGNVQQSFNSVVPTMPKESTSVQEQTSNATDSSEEGLYDPRLEKLIQMALADGELNEKEKQVLFKKAESMGIDLDEFEMVLEAKLYEANNKKQNKVIEPQAAPKSDKYGDVRKCPACGAILKSFITKCPDCGHEISNVEANHSIERLFAALEKVSSEETSTGAFLSRMGLGDSITSRKVNIINNFPIPNTKEDILEFLALATPQTKCSFFAEQRDKELAKAWKKKCEQIIMKAKFALKDDPKVLEEILRYAKEMKIKI